VVWGSGSGGEGVDVGVDKGTRTEAAEEADDTKSLTKPDCMSPCAELTTTEDAEATSGSAGTGFSSTTGEDPIVFVSRSAIFSHTLFT